MLNRSFFGQRLVNWLQTVRQLRQGRNVFDEMASRDLPVLASTSTRRVSASQGPSQPLMLPELSSFWLWRRAFSQARSHFVVALAAKDRAEVEQGLAKMQRLMGLANFCAGLGIWNRLTKVLVVVDRHLFECGLEVALKLNLARIGEVRAVDSTSFMDVDKTEERLAVQTLKMQLLIADKARNKLKVSLSQKDLDALPKLWRKGFSRQRSLMTRVIDPESDVELSLSVAIQVMPVMNSRQSRQKIFKAFYEGFDDDAVHEAALELLRARQCMAREMGYSSWSEFELAPFSINTIDDAWKLLDSAMEDFRSAMEPTLRSMDALARKEGLGKPYSQFDEAYLQALALRDVDSMGDSNYFPADSMLKGVLSIAEKAYGVNIQEVKLNVHSSGWASNMTCLEVTDALESSRRLGYIYLQDTKNKSLASFTAGAMLVSAGHCLLFMELPEKTHRSEGRNLLSYTQVQTLAHEMGHAVHMLCFPCAIQDFHNQPLDMVELPSTLLEFIASHPDVLMRFTEHYETGTRCPLDILTLRRRQLARRFQQQLQSNAVNLGLHGPGFDAEHATVDDLRAEILKHWSRFSFVEPDPAFAPISEAIGKSLLRGPNQLGYLIDLVRSDIILCAHGRDVQDALQPEFAQKVRKQLLEIPVGGQRVASMLPPLSGDPAKKSSVIPPHPLPPLQPAVRKGMYKRLMCL